MAHSDAVKESIDASIQKPGDLDRITTDLVNQARERVGRIAPETAI